VEIMEKKDRSCFLLHLLNYNAGHNSPVNNIGVSLRIPDGKKVDNITLLSPDNNKAGNVDFSVEEKRVMFNIPILETYDMAVIKLR
jgi:hypothetical protein